MTELASFWCGGALGPIELASLRSFLGQGDSITVFSPHPLDLPEGVIWRDANEIFPSTTILRHRRSGSPAPHSDLFRYALLAKTGMIWVDLDMIALRPFDFDSPWVFGFEMAGIAGNSVLRLPQDSPALRELLELTPDTRGLPAYLSGLPRLKLWLKGPWRGVPIQRWPWGATGPRALTHALQRSGEIAHALPVSAFYAIPLEEVGRFATPHALTRRDLPVDAWGVHLWASHLRRIIDRDHSGRVPADSLLDLALRGAL